MYICILRCILVRLFYLNICNQYNSITITIIKCNDCVYLFNVINHDLPNCINRLSIYNTEFRSITILVALLCVG